MHVTFGCKNKCTRGRRDLRGCERKAAAVACVHFCDSVTKFSRIEELCMINVAAN